LITPGYIEQQQLQSNSVFTKALSRLESERAIAETRRLLIEKKKELRESEAFLKVKNELLFFFNFKLFIFLGKRGTTFKKS
jgi:hypothetical protein